MPKNGSSKIFWLLKWLGITVVIGPLMFLFLLLVAIEAYSILAHNATLHRLENVFEMIEHPPGATLIEHQTHLGEGPFVSGDGDDVCYYYVAEIRSIPGSFETVMQHYDDQTGRLSGEFSDVEVDVNLIDNNYLALNLDIPTTAWVEEYLMRQSNTAAYMVYMRKAEENVAGDYRCWRD